MDIHDFDFVILPAYDLNYLSASNLWNLGFQLESNHQLILKSQKLIHMYNENPHMKLFLHMLQLSIWVQKLMEVFHPMKQRDHRILAMIFFQELSIQKHCLQKMSKIVLIPNFLIKEYWWRQMQYKFLYSIHNYHYQF